MDPLKLFPTVEYIIRSLVYANSSWLIGKKLRWFK